jgi:hypothetical protein
MTRTLKISSPSGDEMRETDTHAAGRFGSEAANRLQMTIVPIRRVERIKQLCSVGENIRRIAREEVNNHAAVQKIVRSYATHQYVEEVRNNLTGLLGYAVDAIRHALETKKDGKLAYQLLVDLGAISSSARR